MGLSDVEAGVLSGEAGAEEISWTLRHETQYSRSELHVSATGEGDDHPELAARHASAFSLRGQGASGDHAHQAAQGGGGFCAAISGHDRTAGCGGQTGARAVSASAESESR